jgi:plastocyanin
VRPQALGRDAEQAARAERRRFLALVGAAAGFAWHRGVAGAEPARNHRVVIQGLQYQPEALVVRRGDSVVWINDDPMPHTVTAAGEFDSGTIEAGKSWRFVARRAGRYRYVCTLHSNMRGSLRVE